MAGGGLVPQFVEKICIIISWQLLPFSASPIYHAQPSYNSMQMFQHLKMISMTDVFTGERYFMEGVLYDVEAVA